jgi:glutaminyl-peptide cyclotransferase
MAAPVVLVRRMAGGFMLALVLSTGCVQETAPVSTQQESAGEEEEAFAYRDAFAAGRDASEIATVPFDGKRALGYLEDVCRIGPRISATEGMTKQQEMLRKHFEKLGGKVEMQKFSARQDSQKNAVDMANMIVSWHPEQQRRIIICSHYDTRPIADEEKERRNWRLPFLSANDGGSGAAFLMELAHHMKDLKLQVGVDFVLFDGEEYIWEKGDHYFFGSEHFAKTYRNDKPKHKYLAAVLLDMIAGKGAKFPVEPNSNFLAGKLVEDIWTIAREQKCDAFQMHLAETAVQDDHIALNRIGKIPAIDIIDFDYAHWHKLSDVPNKCAPEPLEQVAKVLTVWAQRMK